MYRIEWQDHKGVWWVGGYARTKEEARRVRAHVRRTLRIHWRRTRVV